LDATASRQPTWDRACGLQGTMFEAIAGLGDLSAQLVYYRGGEFQASSWVTSAGALHDLMRGVHCVTGGTQIGRVLQHAIGETRRERVGALIFIGDCMEENADELIRLATEIGRHETPIFLFQEGNDPRVAQAFSAMAVASGGAHLAFDLAGIEQLKELLGAVAIYAVGGKEALVEASNSDRGAALLLTHLKSER
jgi:hypothetical protein